MNFRKKKTNRKSESSVQRDCKIAKHTKMDFLNKREYSNGAQTVKYILSIPVKENLRNNQTLYISLDVDCARLSLLLLRKALCPVYPKCCLQRHPCQAHAKLLFPKM